MDGKTRVMFVCSGNICRSPMAHGLFLDRIERRGVSDRFEVESSGTSDFNIGEDMDERGRNELAKHGVTFNHAVRTFEPWDAEDYDLILTMERSNHEKVLGMIPPEFRDRVRMFRDFDPEAEGEEEVPDPYFSGRNGFSEVYRITERTVDALLEKLLNR